jgi:hypothetical protein
MKRPINDWRQGHACSILDVKTTNRAFGDPDHSWQQWHQCAHPSENGHLIGTVIWRTNLWASFSENFRDIGFKADTKSTGLEKLRAVRTG